jgi:hypothetical protein
MKEIGCVMHGKGRQVAETQPHSITLNVSEEFHERFVNEFVIKFGGSPEEVAMFLLEQVMTAPEVALQWMLAKRAQTTRSWENPQAPKGANAFEAFGDVVREEILLEHRPAIELAASLATYIKHATKPEPKAPASYEGHGRTV